MDQNEESNDGERHVLPGQNNEDDRAAVAGGLNRDSVERSVGEDGRLRGLRCDTGACHVTRSEFEYALEVSEGSQPGVAA